MISKEIMLKNEDGLHARPATEIAKNASKYSCSIKFDVRGVEYNAKSVLNIMSAGIKNNTPITIICDGVDENQALTEIVEMLENLPRNGVLPRGRLPRGLTGTYHGDGVNGKF